MRVTSNLANSKKCWINLNFIFKLQYRTVLVLYDIHGLLKDYLKLWDHDFLNFDIIYFLYYASSLSTWFFSNSKGWAADLEIVYETLKWKNLHLSRSLHSIFHTHLMSKIRSPLPFECSLCQLSPVVSFQF